MKKKTSIVDTTPDSYILIFFDWIYFCIRNEFPITTFHSFYFIFGSSGTKTQGLEHSRQMPPHPRHLEFSIWKCLDIFTCWLTQSIQYCSTDSQRRYERERTLNSVLPEISIPWLVIKHSISCCCTGSNSSCTFSAQKRKKGKREQVNQATVSTGHLHTC